MSPSEPGGSFVTDEMGTPSWDCKLKRVSVWRNSNGKRSGWASSLPAGGGSGEWSGGGAMDCGVSIELSNVTRYVLQRIALNTPDRVTCGASRIHYRSPPRIPAHTTIAAPQETTAKIRNIEDP